MPERRLRGVRGAISVDRDDAEQIHAATRELLDALLARNALERAHVVSMLFTITSDLTQANPARAARLAGWHDVPMLCALEAPVEQIVPRCIRVLLHAELPATQPARHVYLKNATALRPDLA